MKKSTPVWKEDALELVRELRRGGIILSATDTVWGLGCDATSAEAVSRMARLKNRPEEKTFLVLVGDEGGMHRILPDLPDAAWELMEVTDRPLTVVGQAGPHHGLAPGLVRSNGSIGVRWVQDPYMQFILNGLGKPVASSSANLHGEAPAQHFKEFPSSITSGVDAIGTHGRDQFHGVPSWIVQFDESARFHVLRS